MTEEIKVIPTNGTSADDVKYAKRVKEIYIDGIDVAGCENYSPLEYLQTNNGYDEHPDYCGNYIDHICVNHSNCYYKQLKRKEAECEELKNKIKYCFEELSENYDTFCDICIGKGKCNNICCYEQLKELIYEN